MTGRVAVARQGRVGFLIFDHEQRHNAISIEMWRQIPVAAAELDAGPEVRVVVLRGAGEAGAGENSAARTP